MGKYDELMVKVANMYYDRNMCQEVIAKKLFISRSKVSRLLCDAREIGLVEILIHTDIERNEYLEKQFRNRFDLKDVIITKRNMNENIDNVTEFAANYVDSMLSEGMIIGVSRGKTIEAFADKFRDFKNMPIEVVQMIGAMDKGADNYKEIEIIRRIASAYNGRYHYLLSPFATKSQTVYEAFKEMDINKVAIEAARKSELIIGSVGAKNNGRIGEIWEKFLGENDIKKLEESNAVGVFFGHYFDINGNLIDLDIKNYIVGLSIEEIKEKSERICIATGDSKVKPIIGAMRAKLFNILIVDEDTALEVLISERR